jgi:hypothetical protein
LKPILSESNSYICRDIQHIRTIKVNHMKDCLVVKGLCMTSLEEEKVVIFSLLIDAFTVGT